MSLKVVQAELLKTLDDQLAAFVSDGYQWGLYKNNWTPANGDTISAVTPCDFSGYAGLQNFAAWNAATWVSPRAEADADDVVWTHNGGGTSNDVYGYYVVDGSGNLAWGERNAAAPVTISGAGQTYTVKPKYTRRSEF
jgi:hypothetical protein